MSTDARRTATDDGLFIVGLVGQAGSGKSTVARALAEDGARLIEADVLGHEITDHDPEVRRALSAEYGPDVYRADGTLDRARVAARVFTDREARGRLDALVHPRIVRAIRERLERLRAEGFRGVVVVDAALMLDWNLERECDALLAIVAAERDQLERLARERGWSDTQARARMAVQRAHETFRAAADVTLDNRGSLESLRHAAREAVRSLRSSRAEARPRDGSESC